MSDSKEQTSCNGKKQVADFIIKTDVCFVKKEDRWQNLRSLTFAKYDIKKT